MTRGSIVVLTCALASACSPAPEVPRVHATIGAHNVSFESPGGWEHLDHGLEHRFQSGLNLITVVDHGPVTPEGFLREIHHARELFENAQLEDARAHLVDLDLRSLFSDPRRWREISESWTHAVDGGKSRYVSRYEAEVGYDEVIKEVTRLAPRELSAIVEDVFPSIETAAHREIAELVSVELGGLLAMRVETWDRLSHDHRQSYLFVINEGNLLVMRMEMGKYAEMLPAFETIAASLEFHSAAITS